MNFLKPTSHQFSVTFIVREAIVEALRSIWCCWSVEGGHRKRARRWRLCTMLYQHLFCKSKNNCIILQGFPTLCTTNSAIFRNNLPSSWRRYWFPPRSRASDQASPSSLSQNSTTLFLSNCTQEPSELTTWCTNNTLYLHSENKLIPNTLTHFVNP